MGLVKTPQNRGPIGHFNEITCSSKLKFRLAIDFGHTYAGTQKNSGHLDEVTITLVHATARVHMTFRFYKDWRTLHHSQKEISTFIK